MTATRLKVLFLDDERDNLMAMRRVFRADFEVLVAGSIAEALALLQNGAVDVAVVDYAMPRENGITFLKQSQGKVLRGAVVLTAYADRADVQAAALGAGARVCAKPWKPTILRALIKEVGALRTP